MSEDALERLRAKAVEKLAQREQAPKAVDPYSLQALLRAANEDDDLYDPYSDYMDQLARSSVEEPCQDPWR